MSTHGDEPRQVTVIASTPLRVTLAHGRKTNRSTGYKFIAPTKSACIREILFRAASRADACRRDLAYAEQHVAKLRAALAKADK
jgi:hypothetical protein